MEWGDVARLRQGLYRFYAAGLLPPDDDRMESLEAGAALLDEMGIEQFAFAAQWWELLAVLEERETVAELRGEYVRLFASGTDGGLCPPMESFYVTSVESGGQATLVSMVEREYREMGLAMGSEARQAPDHAAVELEAMAMLAAEEAALWRSRESDAALARVLNRQRSFIGRRLAQWFPAFQRRVAVSSDGFYPALVGACGAFLYHDGQYVELLLRDILASEPA